MSIEFRMHIVFKGSARIDSILGLIDMLQVETGDKITAWPMNLRMASLVLTGFEDKAIRRRCFHLINSRYHNMVLSINEVDVRSKDE